jgi:hypothetical protein
MNSPATVGDEESTYRTALDKLIQEGSLRKLYTREKYYQIIDLLLLNKSKSTSSDNKKKTPEEYYFLDQFDVMHIGNGPRLIKKLLTNHDISGIKRQEISVYVHLDEIYHIINSVHKTIGHGGIRKTLVECKKIYENITFPCVKIFIDLCKFCTSKKSRSHNNKKSLTNKSVDGIEDHNSSSIDSCLAPSIICSNSSHSTCSSSNDVDSIIISAFGCSKRKLEEDEMTTQSIEPKRVFLTDEYDNSTRCGENERDETQRSKEIGKLN